MVFGRPFLKRFALCYQTVVLSVTLVYCGQTAGRIKMKLGMQVGLIPSHTVLDGDPAFPQKGHSPQFSAHVHCGQMAGWIKMPLGTEVGQPRRLCVRWGPSSPQKGVTAPNFRPMSIMAKWSSISATAELLFSLRLTLAKIKQANVHPTMTVIWVYLSHLLQPLT